MQKPTGKWIAALSATFVLGVAPAAVAQSQPADVSQIIQAWPETSRSAAEAMIEKYGQPQETT